MIYLASPLSDPSGLVMRDRFQAACRQAAKMMRDGLTVCSPVAHSYWIALYGRIGLTDHDFWQRMDRPFLEACDEVWVLKLPGWDTSKGVAAEIALARELGKEVTFVDAS